MGQRRRRPSLFQAWLRPHFAMATALDAKSRAKEIFRKYDNGTGLISVDELSSILATSIANVSREDLLDVCKRAGLHGEYVRYEAFLDVALAEELPDASATPLRPDASATSQTDASTTLRPPASDCGHVFILHCNAEGLAADAVLALMEVRCGKATVRQRGAAGKSTVYEAIQDGDPSISGSACC